MTSTHWLTTYDSSNSVIPTALPKIKLEVSAIAAAKAFAKFHRSLEVTRPGRKRIDGKVTFGAEDLGWSPIPVEYSSPRFNAVTSMTTR